MSTSRRATTFVAAWSWPSPDSSRHPAPRRRRAAGGQGRRHHVQPPPQQLRSSKTRSGSCSVRHRSRASWSTSAALQAIADANDGTRASGTPGYDASAAYVRSAWSAPATTCSVQAFDFYEFAEAGPSELEQTHPNPMTYVEGHRLRRHAALASPGDVTAAVTPVDVALGAGQHLDQRLRGRRLRRFPRRQHRAAPARHVHVRDQGGERRGGGRGRGAVLQPGRHRRARRAGHPGGDARQRLHRRHPGAQHDVRDRRRAVPDAGLACGSSRTSAAAGSVTATSSRSPGAATRPTSSWPAPTSTRCPRARASTTTAPARRRCSRSRSSWPRSRTANKMRFAWWGAEEGGLVGSTVLRQRPGRQRPRRAGRHRDVPQLRHGRLAELRPVPLRRRRVRLRHSSGPDGSDEIEALFARYYSRCGACPPRPRRSTGVPTTRRSSTTGSRRAACSPGPRDRRRRSRSPSGAVPRRRVRPLLPLGVRHDRQPQRGGAATSTPTRSPTRSSCSRPGRRSSND